MKAWTKILKIQKSIAQLKLAVGLNKHCYIKVKQIHNIFEIIEF